jgi:cbb3-type cytochrome c oxidase subunit III
MIRSSLLASTLIFTVVASLAAQHEMDAHRHPEAEKIKNPATADATSIAAGQALFVKHCSSCHGDMGKGDGMMGEELDPKPANLTDAEWKHGSSDGEIFTVIGDGVKGTGMKSFSKKLTVHQIWDVVNYVRSIGPSKPH